MFLIQVVLRVSAVSTLLLQTSTTTSAFLSPLTTTTNNGKQLAVPQYQRSGSQSVVPSKSSLYVLPPSTVSILPTAVLSELLDTTFDLTSTPPPPVALPTATIEGLSPTTNTIVFVLGLIPFLWATYEFWSRIASGASFGTGADSIQIRPGNSDNGTGGTSIGEDGNPSKSRGRKVLGDDALLVAYVLFAVAIGSVGIAVYSVVSSPLPPM